MARRKRNPRIRVGKRGTRWVWVRRGRGRGKSRVRGGMRFVTKRRHAASRRRWPRRYGQISRALRHNPRRGNPPWTKARRVAAGRKAWRTRVRRIKARGAKFTWIGPRRVRVADGVGRRRYKRRGGSSKKRSLAARKAWAGRKAMRGAARGFQRLGRAIAYKHYRGRFPGLSSKEAYALAKYRSNPRRRRRGYRHNPTFRRRYRRNPARGLLRGFGGIPNLLLSGAMAYFAGRAFSGVLTQLLGRIPFVGGLTSKLGSHLPAATALGALALGNYLSKPGKFLAKYRTPILVGTSIVAAETIYRQYVARFVPAKIAPWLGLGQIPAYWQTPWQSYKQGVLGGDVYEAAAGMGEYVEVPPGVGLGFLQEAAAGMGEYIEVPPGVGLGRLHEAAAGMGEYVEVAPGMQGIPAGYQGSRIAALPPGRMPIPRTVSPGEAAYESQQAGEGGIFDGGMFSN